MKSNNDKGWVRIPRSLLNDELLLSGKASIGQACIDLIGLATYKDTIITIKGIVVNLKRGQLAWSIKKLAKRWNRNERTVRNYLEVLSKTNRIHFETSNVTTLITILNYDQFQGNAERTTSQVSDLVHTGIHTNKNRNNPRKENQNSSDVSIDPALAKAKRQEIEYSKLRAKEGDILPDIQEFNRDFLRR